MLNPFLPIVCPILSKELSTHLITTKHREAHPCCGLITAWVGSHELGFTMVPTMRLDVRDPNLVTTH
jgi:hypothetical protein